MPPSQLLVFDVREGWEPLCQFLDVSIPDTSFPNINDASEVRFVFNAIWLFCWFTILGVPALLALCLYCGSTYTLLGLVLVIPLMWLAGKLVMWMVRRQTDKSKQLALV